LTGSSTPRSTSPSPPRRPAASCVLTQQLLPKAFGGGRVLAYELMIATPAVRALIREGKSHQLRSVIQTGGQFGMVTMDACLADLYKRKLITYELGLARAVDPKEFMRLAGVQEKPARG
jgi:twitching motility protein PilT